MMQSKDSLALVVWCCVSLLSLVGSAALGGAADHPPLVW